jgi:hypothetical protein
LFFLLLLIFLIISDYKFDQVFDVMLQSISSPRREAASPPSPRCTKSQNAVTLGALQLHFVNAVTNRIQGLCLALFLNGAAIFIGLAGGMVEVGVWDSWAILRSRKCPHPGIIGSVCPGGTVDEPGRDTSPGRALEPTS